MHSHIRIQYTPSHTQFKSFWNAYLFSNYFASALWLDAGVCTLEYTPGLRQRKKGGTSEQAEGVNNAPFDFDQSRAR